MPDLEEALHQIERCLDALDDLDLGGVRPEYVLSLLEEEHARVETLLDKLNMEVA